MIIAAFAGVAVALFRVADRRDAERSTQQAQESTTAPSAGFDRQPTDGPAATSATTSPTTAPADDEGPPVILKGDGIGAFLFGADPDQVLAGLTLRWGPPDGDSGWVAARSSPYGPCPGTVVRGVDWRGFTVLFSDGATPWGKSMANRYASSTSPPSRNAPASSMLTKPWTKAVRSRAASSERSSTDDPLGQEQEPGGGSGVGFGRRVRLRQEVREEEVERSPG